MLLTKSYIELIRNNSEAHHMWDCCRVLSSMWQLAFFLYFFYRLNLNSWVYSCMCRQVHPHLTKSSVNYRERLSKLVLPIIPIVVLTYRPRYLVVQKKNSEMFSFLSYFCQVFLLYLPGSVHCRFEILHACRPRPNLHYYTPWHGIQWSKSPQKLIKVCFLKF